MTEHATCSTCRWWAENSSNNEIGECRANPPVMLSAKTYDAAFPGETPGMPSAYKNGVWPDTFYTHWCAQHTPAEAEAATTIEAAEVPPCDLGYATEHGRTTGIPPECVEAWYAANEAVAWQFRGTTIRDWRASLRSYAVKWRANESRRPAKGESRNAGTLQTMEDYE